MRIARRETITSILVLSMFMVTISWVPPVILTNDTVVVDSTDAHSSRVYDDGNPELIKEDSLQRKQEFYTSDSDSTGVLNPATFEQVGYTSSGTIPARTDSMLNTHYPLPLDEAHSWVGSQVDLNVSELTRLFALNGSFTEGTPSGETFAPNGTADYYPYGWGVSSTTGSTDPAVIQRVAYEATGRKYVVVETKARLTNNPQHIYTHYSGTSVYWNQSIDVTPSESNFILSFDYLYQNGPIDGTGPDSFTSNAYIEVIVDDVVVHSISLKDLPQRNMWFSTGNIPISLTPSQNPTMFKIGIHVNTTFSLDADSDYDYTPGPDGATNAEFITVQFDDVAFTAASPPEFEQVDLKLNVEETSTSVIGSSGSGSASLEKADYWTANPVNVQVTSNTTVSFEYETVIRVHRFSNSTWLADPSKIGVAYSVASGGSPQLLFNTYIGFLGSYINLTTRAWFPSDWENVTILDPFLSDVTANCTVLGNMLEIPTSLMNRLGWWSFSFESPNYAKSIQTQIFDVSWENESNFRIGNTTRADIIIGTASQTLDSLTDVNVTWFKPQGITWFSELINGGILGQINSTDQTFLSGLSPAGEWWVEVSWQNGTEVAYDSTRFAVHHTANLISDYSLIETDTGLTVTATVRYTDGDTGTNLLDPSATVTGYWSAPSVTFIPNTIHNWWEGTFDTSLVGEGEFTVIVNATHMYYDPASCQITLQSTRVTRLSSPNAPWTADEWGRTTELTFNYEYYDYTTSSWGPISNDTTVSMSLNWTLGSWSVGESTTPGIYMVNVSTGVKNSGTWLLNVTFSKPNHQTKTIFLTLIVSPATSSLSILGDISARVNLDEEQSVKLTYRGRSGNPISGANVVIDSVSPSIGLAYSTVDAVSGEPGNYSVSLTPHAAGVFTIRFVATETNSEPAIAVFVLVVNDVATILDISGPTSVEIGLTDVYNTTFRFSMLNNTGISNAQINITYSGGIPGALSISFAEQSMGNYSVEFSSAHAGTYLITIAASKLYYQPDSDAFFLIVGAIKTNMTSLNGTAGVISFEKDYLLFVKYTNRSGYGLDGANVDIVSVTPETGLYKESAVPQGGGVYSFKLTPLAAGTYNLLIRASLEDYDSGFVAFSITGTAKRSSLIILNSTATVSYDHNFTVYMFFQSEDLTGLENATIEPVDPPGSLIFSNTSSLGYGLYSINIQPSITGSFLIELLASALNHFDAISVFILNVVDIPTQLRIENGISSASVEFLKGYDMLILYERTDNPTNISDAIIQVNFTSAEKLNWSIYMLAEGYLIQFETDLVGRWEFSITSSKPGYQSDAVQFTLFINEIGTSITGSQPNEAIQYGKSYTYNFQYTLSSNSSIGIPGCNVSYTGPGSDWLTAHDLGGGLYSITVTPEGLGIYDVQLSFSKLGYQDRIVHFQFTANAARLQLVMNPLVWYRLSPLNITLKLVEETSLNSIPNALVTYRLYHGQNLEMEGFLNETEPGTYTTIINPSWYDGVGYSVYISVEKQNYVLGSSINPISIEQVTTEDVAVALFFATVVPPLAISIIFISAAIVGQIVYRRRKKSRLAKDLANKHRFDDADNIIGVIILHKKSGIPIYSRMMKGGFEEGIVAAFITAITHFREEFEMFDAESMAVIPISDIIRAVQTRNLICAFVTVKSASVEHNRNIEDYARQVSRFLDDLLDGRPEGIIDQKIADMLDYIFNTTMDGFLLQYYKVATSEKFPKRYQLLDDVLHDTDTRHCTKPVLLAKGIASYGVPEARGCTLVLEAIEKELIVLCEEEETEAMEFKFADFFAQPDKSADSEA